MRAIILATVAALLGAAPVCAESRLPTEVAALPPASQLHSAPTDDGVESILVTAVRPQPLEEIVVTAVRPEPLEEILVTATRPEPMEEIVVTAVRPRHRSAEQEVALRR
jgi:hypothetical protein